MMPSLPTEDNLDFDTQAGVMAGLRESWKQVMNNDVRPISELWDALDDELDSAQRHQGLKPPGYRQDKPTEGAGR